MPPRRCACRWFRRWRGWTLAALVAVLVASLALGAIVPPNAAADTPTEKRLVDATDRDQIAAAQARGGRLAVDYGSFQLWLTPVEASRSASSSRGSSPAPNVTATLRLRDDTIVTRGAGAAARRPASSAVAVGGARLWLAQFIGPIKHDWLTLVASTGAEIVAPLPPFGQLLWATDPQIRQLEAIAARDPVLEWTGPYLPTYKIAAPLRSIADPNAPVTVTVQIVTTRATTQTTAAIGALGVLISPPTDLDRLTAVRARVTARDLVTISQWPDVVNIEPWAPARRLDEMASQIVVGNVISTSAVLSPTGPGYLRWLTATAGFPVTPTAYPIVAVIDDGIDNGLAAAPNDPGFREGGASGGLSRIVFGLNCTTDPRADSDWGHGNLNAGIIGFANTATITPSVDANGFNRGLGVNPFVRLGNVKNFSNTGPEDISACGGSYSAVLSQTAAAGARVSSNSWGSPTSGSYQVTDQIFDRATRYARPGIGASHPMLHIVAAGNYGGIGGTSITSPGNAKNVLTIGATEGLRDPGVPDGCGIAAAANANNIASFSGRGPTADGRAKPDLVAPGTHIAGPATQIASYNGFGVCDRHYPTGQFSYTWSSGTSHATPLAAGVASLLDNAYTRALAPGQTASPAMLKALLINASRHLSGTASGGALPGVAQGWGGVNLAPAIDPTVARILVDQTRVFTQTGQTDNRLARIVSSTQQTRITLVWTDPPGAPFAGKQLVNDLDLEVSVNGQLYRGNVFAGAFSAPGGSADDRNTVEQIVLPAGITGTLRIRVVARNLAGQAILERAEPTNQDFALVVTNAEALPTPDLQIVAHSGATPSGSAFATPGERFSITVTVANVGSGAATNLTATLAVIAGPASVLTGSAPLPPIGPGMTATTITPFVVQIAPSAQCLDRARLHVAVTFDDLGPVVETVVLTVGPVSLSPPQTFAYTGPPVFVPDAPAPNTPGPAAVVSVTVPSTGTIGAVVVRVYAPSTAMGDVTLDVTAPNGVTVTLANRVGGTGPGFGSATADLVFTDDASTPIESAVSFVGAHRPHAPLRALVGGPASGVWTLTARDFQPFDVSQLTRFAIDLQTVIGACPSPATPTPSPTTPSLPLSTTIEGRVVSVTFFTVTTTGGITVTPLSLSTGSLPNDLVGLPFAYTVQTTAQAQAARVCLSYTAADLVGVDPSALRLLFWRDGQWIESPSVHAGPQRTVCAETAQLTPVRIAGRPLIGPNARLSPVYAIHRGTD